MWSSRVMSVAGWHSDWVPGADGHLVIRYTCPDCGANFDVKPGTRYRLRDRLAAGHSADHLIAEAEAFLNNKETS
jgi:hypothetical protein